jgi:hypothetical protein
MAFPDTCCRNCRRLTMVPHHECYDAHLFHDGVRFRVQIPDFAMLKCTECGTVQVDATGQELLKEHLRVAARLLSADEIHAGCKLLQLSGEELAQNIDATSSDVRRWLFGEPPSIAADLAMRNTFQKAAMAVAGLALNWTWEQPTHAGLYYAHYPQPIRGQLSRSAPVLVEVFLTQRPNGLPELRCAVFGEKEPVSVALDTFDEWCGPLPGPPGLPPTLPIQTFNGHAG